MRAATRPGARQRPRPDAGIASAGKFHGAPPFCLSRLFNHLVGAGEQRWRHIDPDHFGRLQIDDEFELA